MHWSVNYLGHFYLTYLLWPKIMQSNSFRILNVSSRAHLRYIGFFGKVSLDFQNINFDKNYDSHLAYSRSKIYNVLFTRALSSKINPQKGKVVSIDPGVVRTDITRELTGKDLTGRLMNAVLTVCWPIWCLISKDVSQGMQSYLYGLLSDDAKNGCYYSNCH